MAKITLLKTAIVPVPVLDEKGKHASGETRFKGRTMNALLYDNCLHEAGSTVEIDDKLLKDFVAAGLVADESDDVLAA